MAEDDQHSEKPGSSAPVNAERTGDQETELLSVASAFSASLSIGGKPDIEDWLAKVPPHKRKELLNRLQSLADDYASYSVPGRMPSADASKETVATAKSQEEVDSASMTRGGGSLHLDQPEGPLKPLGNYVLECELGRGGMGVVYQARNVNTNDVVALKILPSVDGESLHRFKREARSLYEVSHPNLIDMRPLEQFNDQWFFTMNLIESPQTLSSFVRPSGQLDSSRLHSAMLQLCEGVHQLHQFDVLHRDLKPSNVLVDANGRVVVLDFGLVSELKRIDQSLTVQSISGTPAYMSPEAAAGEQESFASDWYSVGVMLYQALSGKLPFEGDLVQVLQSKRKHDAPPFQLRSPSDAPLQSLCMRLLSRQPDKRPGYEEIRAALGATSTTESAKVQGTDAILGRNWQMSSLRSYFARVEQESEPAVVFVSGKSGEGKSALVAAFLAELKESHNVAVLAGRCYDRESVPFKALDSLVDALASYLRSMDPLDTAILLPDDIGILAIVFPILTRVEVIAKIPPQDFSSLDEQQIRKRAFAALKELLRRLSSKVSLVLFCDDLQWGDSDSALATIDVLSGADIPKVLFIGSFRSDERENSPFLNTWQSNFHKNEKRAPAFDVEVGPLGQRECRELVDTRFPGLSAKQQAALANELFSESAGNAFFFNELLDSLQVQEDRIRRVPMADVLREKLSNLPADAQEILNMISVSGQAIQVRELLLALGLEANAHTTLNAMRSRRLVRFLDDDAMGRIDTYHDKIRETSLAAIESAERKNLHERLGLTIESSYPQIDAHQLSRLVLDQDPAVKELDRVFDLSFHFHSAGDRTKAAAYSLLAAERAKRQFSPEVAAERFRMASQHLDSESEPQLRFRCATGLGQALMLLGRYRESESALAGVLELTDDNVQKAAAESVLAEVYFKQAKLEGSKAYCMSGLARLGEWVPQSNLGIAYAMCRDVTIQAFHSLFLRFRRRNDSTEESRLIGTLMSRITYISCFNSVPLMAWGTTRAMNLGERYKPSSSLALAYGLHSAICTFVLGWEARGDAYYRRARQINEGAGDLWGLAHSICWQGVSCFARARYREGIELLEQASKQFAEIGDAWEENFAKFHLGMCHFALGEIDTAKKITEATCKECIDLGDSRALCSSYGWSRSTEGAFPMESLDSQLPRVPGDFLSTVNYYKAVGFWHLANGRAEEAVEKLDDALKIMVTHKHYQAHTFAILPLLVSALRGHASAIRDVNVSESTKLLRRANKLGFVASSLGNFFPTERAAALREYGLVVEAKGKKQRALKLLKKSCAVATKQEEAYELAKSKFELARLQFEFGKGSEEAVREAQLERDRFVEVAKAKEPLVR